MSRVNLQRVKQIRRKNSNNVGDYLPPIPIGTDGLLVDMVSQLDLEEQIRLGGNHYASIIETDTSTEIQEWYFSQAKGNRSLQDMDQLVTYFVSVSITDINISQDFIVDNNGNNISDGENALVNRVTSSSSGGTKIIMSLYQGNKKHLLHTKIVDIIESTSGKTIINEQVS